MSSLGITSIPWVRVRKIQDDCIRLSLGYSSYQSIYIMSRSYSDLKLRGSGILGRARASALVSKISINPRNRDVAAAIQSLFYWTIIPLPQGVLRTVVEEYTVCQARSCLNLMLVPVTEGPLTYAHGFALYCVEDHIHKLIYIELTVVVSTEQIKRNSAARSDTTIRNPTESLLKLCRCKLSFELFEMCNTASTSLEVFD